MEAPPSTAPARERRAPTPEELRQVTIPPASNSYGPHRLHFSRPHWTNRRRSKFPSEERPVLHCTTSCEVPEPGKPRTRTNKCYVVPTFLRLSLPFRTPIRTTEVLFVAGPLWVVIVPYIYQYLLLEASFHTIAKSDLGYFPVTMSLTVN
jgi:hypothetical protein